MILKINYDHKPDVIVELNSSLEGVWWNVVFESDDFYKRYYASNQTPSESMTKLHEDIVDTYLNIMGSVPYSKDEILTNSKIHIINLTRHIKPN